MYDTKINQKQKKLYEKKGYWTDKTLLDYWNNSVSRFANKEFIVDGKGSRYTYKKLDEDSSILARYLIDIGIEEGDIISYQIPIWSEFALICIACMKVGAVMNPIGRRCESEEIKYFLELTKSKLFICPTRFDNRNYEVGILSIKNDIKSLEHIILLEGGKKKEGETISLREILESGEALERQIKVSSNDLAAILWTSGTTGGSKGVMLTHNNIIFSERQFGQELGLTDKDIMFMAAPLHHATGFHHGILLPMIYGGRVVLQGKFDAAKAIKIMNREECTYSMGCTTFIYDVLEELRANGGSLKFLKFFLCGGAAVPTNMVYDASKFGIKLCEVYGTTESVPHVFVRPKEVSATMKSTSGKPMVGVEVRIVDNQGIDVEDGIIGEEVSRGPNVFVGYLKNPEETKKALDKDGWFYSGDLCVRDESGNITIMGRKKDMIVRGGINLNPNEISEKLMQCEYIQDQTIIGMPDERLGERICAYIVPKVNVEKLELEQILEYLKSEKVAKKFWPERIELIDSIPRTDSGKVKKYILEEDINRKLLDEGKIS